MRKIHHIIMDCHISKLPEQHQVTIVHLINHLASHPNAYQQHAMKRIEKIQKENPYTDDIEGFDNSDLW
tara:strand:- start:60 stop:266 length:207 start_codon:yes stop_codon:yes gene_type:complete